MKILNENPPNIDKIKAKFAIQPEDKVVFTYGDTIYNPSNGTVDAALDAHESVHMQQQGSDPEGWWDKYIEDVNFRLSQELEAYRVQYKKFRHMNKSKKARASFVDAIAKDLSSHIYGNSIDYYTARQKIKYG